MIVLPPEGKIVPVEPFVIQCNVGLFWQVQLLQREKWKIPSMHFPFYEIYLGTSWGLNIDEDQLNVDNKNLPK